MTKLIRAKDVLLDAEKRKLYDLYGEKGLTMMTKVSPKGEEFREALESKMIEEVLNVSEPQGHITAGVSVVDAVDAARGKRSHWMAPEVSYFSTEHQYRHPLSATDSLIVHGYVGTTVNKRPLMKRGKHYYERHSPAAVPGVGLEWKHQMSDVDYHSLTATTDGQDMTLNATKVMPLDDDNIAIGTIQHTMSNEEEAQTLYSAAIQRKLVREEDKSVDAFARINLGDAQGYHLLSVGVDANSRNKTHISASINFDASAFAREVAPITKRLPDLRLTWKKHHGPSVSISVHPNGTLALGYTVTRAIDKHSSLRFGSSIGTNGIIWNFEYRRSNQRLAIPIQVTEDVPSPSWLFGLFFAPLALDLFTQHVLLAPYRRRRALQKRDTILKGIRRARMEQRFMRAEADEIRRGEIDCSGIVVLQARFGRETETSPAYDEHDNDVTRVPKWMDVAVVLQQRVYHEKDHSRLVIAEDFPKIPGFYDVCPDEDKELVVHYLYQGVYHMGVIEEGEPVILPQADHRHEGSAWKRRDFDWPLDGSVGDDKAEGAASKYNGVD